MLAGFSIWMISWMRITDSGETSLYVTGISTTKVCARLTGGSTTESMPISEVTPMRQPRNGHTFSLMSGSCPVNSEMNSLSPLTVPRMR